MAEAIVEGLEYKVEPTGIHIVAKINVPTETIEDAVKHDTSPPGNDG